MDHLHLDKNKFVDLMRSRDLNTGAAVARAMQVSDATISRIMRDLAYPGPGFMAAFMRAFPGEDVTNYFHAR